MIAHFFPRMIDQLRPDEGGLRGPAPVIIEGKLQDFMLYLVGNERGVPIEFGAHQVCLYNVIYVCCVVCHSVPRL